MFTKVLAKWVRGRSAKAERCLREAVCQPLEERRLLSTAYVDVNSPGPTRDGTSWGSAYADLQLALGAAVSGDTIRVADGTYRPTAGTTRTISFQLKTGVGIFGGYAGYGAADPDSRSVLGNPTILSGDIGTVGSNSDNSYHVVVGSGTSNTAVLDGVTITGGNAIGSISPYDCGGGMYNSSGSPTIMNCTFSRNTVASTSSGALYGGGGMYNYSSSPTLINCIFIGNTADGTTYRGGGMCNANWSSPTLTNCTFSGNMASYGGGIYNSNSSPTLTNCIVWGNSTAIYNSSRTPVVTYSLIQGGYPDTGNINADPQFVRSPWTGADGVFGTADDDYGDLRLRLGSPALDVGSNAAIPAGIVTDLAGNIRIQNGSVDLGAYEGPVSAPTARTLYVDLNATGNNDGTSWTGAYTSLQSALAASVDGDTIRVAVGTYKPTTTASRTVGFALRNGVALYGGYAGAGAPDPDARDVAANPTILSGDIGTVGKSTDNSYHVLTATCLGNGTILDGFSVILGNASGASPNDSGGGMLNRYSSPILTNCTFSSNTSSSSTSSYGGGGMYNYSSSPTLTDCTFSGNTAICGGGMYNYSSSPTLTNCTFSGNTASSSSSYGGGGMYNYSSSPTLANCTFSGNIAFYGGGMYNHSSSSPTTANCIFWGNSTAIYNNASGTPVATSSLIQGGYAGTGNISADPLFVRSSWTGADGVFGTADDDYGDLHLRTGSPASGMGAYPIPFIAPDPKIIYVDSNAVGANAGTSWTDAFTNLQSALLTAVDGDTIRLADGTYKPASATDRATSFALRNAVAMFGGYAGQGASDPNARDTVIYRTILSGDIGTIGDASDNSFQVLTATMVGGSTALDGVTVTGGTAGSSGRSSSGGGLLALGSSPEIVDCVFIGSSAYSGGGIYNVWYSSPTLINCAFVDNVATSSRGGAIYNSYSSPTLINCTLFGNRAADGEGGMSNYFSNPTLTNCIVWGNGNTPVTSGSVITCSDIQGGYAGPGNISVDPHFVRSPWTGPDGLFGTADDDYGDLRLRAGSPALNIGSSTAVPDGITTDLAGNVRIQDGMVDLGAYEGLTSVPAPRILYVDLNAVGANTGASWADAFANLQSALLAATDGDTIRIADGTYKPTNTTDRAISFAIRNAVAVYGGYAGYGASNANTRDIVAYPTILSGEIGNLSDGSDNSYHVLRARGVGSSTIVDGVTVSGGYAANSNGGGLLATASSPTLANCTFSGNLASYGGGISDDSDSSPMLSNCSFIGNTAMSGGGMYNASSLATLVGCTFSGNTISGSYGAGIYNKNSSTTLTGCALNGNSATGATSYGGGMYNSSTSSTVLTTLTNCVFSGNSASSGGGISNASGGAILTNCTFSGNSATGTSGAGGGVYNSTPSTVPATLTNCTFSRNAASSGGGMYSVGSARLTNCTFVGNMASSGGGIYNSSSSPTLTNCTFIGNRSTVNGGGIRNSSSSPTLTNCIVWGNGSAISNDSSSTPVITYSDIQGGYAGTGNIDAAPEFVRSPWVGPDGLFGTADDDYGDPRLRGGSPAMDVGSNTAIPAGVATDLAGNGRIQNGRVDMGAYEGAASVPAPKTIYVDFSAVGANTGTSWTDAFTSLQPAILVATGGDTVRIADGTYKPTSTVDRTVSFVFKSGVAIYGGYAGYGEANPDARDVAAYPTVLSGDIGAIGDTSDNSYHVIVGSGTDCTAVLDGFTITLGNANGGSSPNDSGGGLYNSAGNPTVRNCIFSGNAASSHGGGVYNVSSSSPMLKNCIFSGNTAVLFGAGMANNASSPTLNYCTFSGNVASAGGGGIDSTSSSLLVLTNCIFGGNTGGTYGGGVINSVTSSMQLANCTFNGNNSTYGGGMYNSDSSATLADCEFSGNAASTYGGGMYNTSSSASATLSNCTFSGNTASTSGGGMYSFISSPTLANCIVWGNSAASDPQICNYSGTLTITYSDIQQSNGKYAGTGNVNADPLFVRNPNVGADGKWGTGDDDYGDLRPQLSSPVIDAGNNAAVRAGVTTDLAGKPRFLNVPGVPDTGLGTAPIVDMGAYERGLVVTTTGSSANEQFSVGLTADKATLQIWSGSSLLGAPTASCAVNTVESCEFIGGGGDDTLTVDVSNGLPTIGVTFTGGDGNDALVLTGTTAGQSVQVVAGQVLVGTAAVTYAGAETIALDAAAGGVVEVGSLTVGTNLAMTAGKNLVLRTGTLNITGDGVLDLAGNSMILSYTGSAPVAAVNRWMANGRMGVTPALKTTGGVYSGTGALGMVDNALVQMSSFAGQSLGGVFSQLLIKQTVAGDTNLDGVVSSADYLAVIANMGKKNAQWFLGDLNCDGIVSVDDLAEVTSSIGDRVTDVSAAMAATAKPVAAKKKLNAVVKAKVVKPKRPALRWGSSAA